MFTIAPIMDFLVISTSAYEAVLSRGYVLTALRRLEIINFTMWLRKVVVRLSKEEAL